MSQHVACLLLLSVSQTAGLSTREGVWGAPDLLVVNQMLDSVLKNSHMSPEQRQLAEHVASDVRTSIAEVVAGKGLSKDARKQKVAAVIAEIQGLERKLAPPKVDFLSNVTDKSVKLAKMRKELFQKQAELVTEENEIKLANLQKQLVEKQMELQELTQQKMKGGASKGSEKEDAEAQGEMVEKLVAMSKLWNSSKVGKGNASAKTDTVEVTTVLANLQARSKRLIGALDNMENVEKANEASLDAMAGKQLPTLGKDDALSRGQSVLKSLRKEEHRKFEKARAVKKAELAELNAAIQSIKKGDAKALQEALQKMKAERKALDTRIGGFLH